MPLKLKRGEWHTLRVTFQGDEITVQIGDVTAKGKHEIIRGPKGLMNLLVFEGSMGFRKLIVTK